MTIKKELFETVIALGVVVGLVLGSIGYFAKAKDLEMVQLRLDQKIMSDSIMQTQQRVWQLEDRNGGPDLGKWDNESDKQEYRKLKEELELRKKQFDNILKK